MPRQSMSRMPGASIVRDALGGLAYDLQRAHHQIDRQAEASFKLVFVRHDFEADRAV